MFRFKTIHGRTLYSRTMQTQQIETKVNVYSGVSAIASATVGSDSYSYHFPTDSCERMIGVPYS
jgi:hypothetical protein